MIWRLIANEKSMAKFSFYFRDVWRTLATIFHDDPNMPSTIFGWEWSVVNATMLPDGL